MVFLLGWWLRWLVGWNSICPIECALCIRIWRRRAGWTHRHIQAPFGLPNGHRIETTTVFSPYAYIYIGDPNLGKECNAVEWQPSRVGCQAWIVTYGKIFGFEWLVPNWNLEVAQRLPCHPAESQQPVPPLSGRRGAPACFASRRATQPSSIPA